MSSEINFILLATTRYGSISVPIYAVPRKDIECDGLTDWHHGKMEINIALELLDKPQRLRAVMLHEMVHVIEYLNDPEYMSVAVENQCTQLAQTMEKGMAQLQDNLRLSPQFIKLSAAQSKPKRSRKTKP